MTCDADGEDFECIFIFLTTSALLKRLALMVVKVMGIIPVATPSMDAESTMESRTPGEFSTCIQRAPSLDVKYRKLWYPIAAGAVGAVGPLAVEEGPSVRTSITDTREVVLRPSTAAPDSSR